MDNTKTIIITGQTATGKTRLALELAKKNEGILISADSRQVYIDLNIGTGKYDNPQDFVTTGDVSELQGVRIFGLNRCSLAERYSAGQFTTDAHKWINVIRNQNKLPIIVGGTGYYINTLLNPPQTAHIPQNRLFREECTKQEHLYPDTKEYVIMLQKKLNDIDSEKLQSMNESDRHNPRRLIRAIEVAYWQKTNVKINAAEQSINAHIVVLYASKKYLEEKITQRVHDMFNIGYEYEVANLLTKHSWTEPGLNTIGYREWKPYFEGSINKDQLIKSIITSHTQYARKQMIYLKHIPGAQWFSVEDPNWRQNIDQYCKI